jgi:lipase maturation factor
MWFLPLRAVVTDTGVLVGRHPVWFVRLVEKLLVADPATLALLGADPFFGQAPNHVRASLYLYRFTGPRERRQSRAYWTRSYVGSYLPARARREMV